jgi:hypothetical protein
VHVAGLAQVRDLLAERLGGHARVELDERQAGLALAGAVEGELGEAGGDLRAGGDLHRLRGDVELDLGQRSLRRDGARGAAGHGQRERSGGDQVLLHLGGSFPGV